VTNIRNLFANLCLIIVNSLPTELRIGDSLCDFVYYRIRLLIITRDLWMKGNHKKTSPSN
jgi:hypothetical protein